MSQHTIFYDAQCPICVREMAVLNEGRHAHEFRTLPVQGNDALLEKYGISAEDALTYLHAVDQNGQVLRGMAAVRLFYRGIDRFTLVKLADLPLLRQLADRLYPWFARNRNRFPAWLLAKPKCENGTCYRR